MPLIDERGIDAIQGWTKHEKKRSYVISIDESPIVVRIDNDHEYAVFKLILMRNGIKYNIDEIKNDVSKN